MRCAHVPAALAGLVIVGCAGPAIEKLDPELAASIEEVTALPVGFQRGMNLEPIGFNSSINLRRLETSLDLLVGLGVDHIAVIPSFFQSRLGEIEFFWRGTRERVDNDTRRVIELAHARGLRVLLKPHLWLDDRSDGSWRGVINPTDAAWPSWSAAYRSALLAYADLAAASDVAGIALGSELTLVALAHPEFWRQLASDVRERFHGFVTYAANWDRELTGIEWWEELDFVGVDAFWPLLDDSDGGAPLTDALCDGRMGTIRDKIGEVAARTGRPVVLSEIGYRSAVGAAHRPWEWHDDTTTPDPDLQASIYACIARVFGAPSGDLTEPPVWLAGVYFWVWYADLSWGGIENTDFTPHGKPAEAILGAWFQRVR